MSRDRVSSFPWPMWKKLAAYTMYAALAVVTVYLVDLKAHRPPQSEPVTPPARSAE